MSLIEINWRPTDRQLRQFGAICLVALPLLGWMWGGNAMVVGALAVAGVAIAATAWVSPLAVRPIYLALTLLATPIGIVIGELVLLLIYFGVFLPVGLVFRLISRDALQRKLDPGAETYWQAKKRPERVASYYRQS